MYGGEFEMLDYDYVVCRYSYGDYLRLDFGILLECLLL